MNLGFHYHTPAYQDMGRIYMPGYLGVFIDSLSPHFNKIVLFLHTPSNEQKFLVNYEIKSKNIDLIGIGEYCSIPSRYAKFYKYLYFFKNYTNLVDILLVRATTPLLPIISLSSSVPVALYLVSNATEGIDKLPQPALRLALIKIWAKWYQKKEYDIASKTLTLVNSKKLLKELKNKVKNLHLVKTTTLSINDFYYREDTCNKKSINLLYTGRITENKGLLDIIESIALLKNEEFDLHLNLVGFIKSNDNILEQMIDKCNKLNLKNIFTYHGYKSVGKELLYFYRTADIFVSASQNSSEGFPRTLWEAMASSLPIVTTSVSSVSYFMKNAGCLVQPNNPKQIADSVKKIIKNKKFRRTIIKNGYNLSKDNTLEKKADELSTIIHSFCNTLA